MSWNVKLVSAFASTLMLVAAAAWAQSSAPQKQEVDADKLVVGDWCEVAIKRQGVEEKLSGHLIQLTDDWLVLGVIICARESTAVPWLGEMPYVGQFFR